MVGMTSDSDHTRVAGHVIIVSFISLMIRCIVWHRRRLAEENETQVLLATIELLGDYRCAKYGSVMMGIVFSLDIQNAPGVATHP